MPDLRDWTVNAVRAGGELSVEPTADKGVFVVTLNGGALACFTGRKSECEKWMRETIAQARPK